ncbi:hypothetical protein [uncultured Flavobacterium sp.]|uniref:hypothetical protein n=1 Tax=uncultured Flavobacterium sp. TaxID=165435 RepID=UPI002597F3F0|nr:hypothetical protein [uncultured Flavobacterium sp.]
MRSTLLFFLTILLFSCKESENLKGDLYFKHIDLTSPIGLTDEQALNVEKWIDSMDLSYQNLKEEDKNLVDSYKNIIKHGLLKNPYLQLETEDGIKKVYLTSKEYHKIKHFKLSDLQEKSKKVTIELKVTELEKDLFYSEEITSIKEVNGKTPWQK